MSLSRSGPMRASIVAAVLAGLVACGSDRPASTTDAGGTGGASATGGASGTAGTSGTAGASGAGGGAQGGAIGHCETGTGAGGSGGTPAGCDLEVARQALATLGIATVGDLRTSTVTLSATLTDAQWSVKAEVCRAGGYDLTPVAGMTVCLVSQVIIGMCQGNPVQVYVLMSNGSVQCVYKALCPGSRITPGVYSTVDPLCGP